MRQAFPDVNLILFIFKTCIIAETKMQFLCLVPDFVKGFMICVKQYAFNVSKRRYQYLQGTVRHYVPASHWIQLKQGCTSTSPESIGLVLIVHFLKCQTVSYCRLCNNQESANCSVEIISNPCLFTKHFLSKQISTTSYGLTSAKLLTRTWAGDDWNVILVVTRLNKLKGRGRWETLAQTCN